MAKICFKWDLNKLFEKPQATYGHWRHTRLFLLWVKGITCLICVGHLPGDSSWSSHGQGWTVRVTLIPISSVGCWQALLSKLAEREGGVGTLGSSFLWTARDICIILVLVWSVICGHWENPSEMSVYRKTSCPFGNFYPCTLTELPQSTEAPQEETGTSSFYWTPAVY